MISKTAKPLSQGQTFRRLDYISKQVFEAAETIKEFNDQFKTNSRDEKDELHSSKKSVKLLLEREPQRVYAFLSRLTKKAQNIHNANRYESDRQSYVAGLKLFSPRLFPELVKEFNTNIKEEQFKFDVIPELKDFVEVFDWLDNLTKASKALSKKQNEDEVLYKRITEKSSQLLGAFTAILKDQVKAIKKPLIDFIDLDFSTGNQLDRMYYQTLEAAKTMTLKTLGLNNDDIETLRGVFQKPYTQNRFSQTKIKEAYNDLFRSLFKGPDFTDALNSLESSIKSFPRSRVRSYTQKLAYVLSHQLDDQGLTMPQRIVNLSHPQKEESAIKLLSAFKEIGVDFDVVNRKNETCLHYIQPHQMKLSKFLANISPISTTHKSFAGKNPQELVIDSPLPYKDGELDEKAVQTCAEVCRNLTPIEPELEEIFS